MVEVIVVALVLGLILAIAMIASPNPWVLDGEFWYEQLPHRRGPDPLVEELAEMRRTAGALRGH